MDFELDTEQEALRDAVRRLLTSAYSSIDGRREATAKDPGFDEQMWRRLAEMGVLGLPFAEADGGMGAGPVEVALVAEQVGRCLAPEPFVEAVVLSGGLVAAAGTAQQRSRLLGGLATGDLVPAFAHTEPLAGRHPGPASVTATRDGDGWLLDGVKEPVPGGARADVLVVSAAVDGRTGLFVVEPDAAGLDRVGYPTYDGGRAARVSFAATPATPLGDAGTDAAPLVERVLADARVAYCHEAVGAMDAALTMTTEYLRTRKQFGVPLRTFQALTFRAADMYVSLELARSLALWATLVLADGDDAVTAADRACVQVGLAGRHIGQEAIQLHGGIGMTAEYAVGHYTARLTTIAHLVGHSDEHLARLATRVRDHGAVDPLEA
ncbi:MAG: acyl-CoA dehydrogenase family protein [Kineosporiaceae bacterium]|jgi:alkylation response protein AidB-like acyl-CoA dehydrogenase